MCCYPCSEGGYCIRKLPQKGMNFGSSILSAVVVFPRVRQRGKLMSLGELCPRTAWQVSAAWARVAGACCPSAFLVQFLH